VDPKYGPQSPYWASVETIAVDPEPEDSDGSDSIDWTDLESSTHEQGEESESSPLSPPKHEPDDELEWLGTMAAYRASGEAVTIVLNDD
jgi:hypothetical protein